jgi:hypothetical protein
MMASQLARVHSAENRKPNMTPREAFPAVVARSRLAKIGKSNQFRLGVVNLSLR